MSRLDLLFPPKSTNVRPIFPPALLAANAAARTLGPRVSASFLMTLFTTPRQFHRPDRERDLLSKAIPFHLRTPAGTLPAWRWGAGPAVALVHGWEGRGAQLAALVEPLVTLGLSVVTFDAPGHGDAPRRRATVIDFADALLALEQHTHGLHAVVAHSMGALATAHAARQGLDPDRYALIAPAVSPARPLAWLGSTLGHTDATLDRVRDRISTAVDLPWDDLAAGGLHRHYDRPTLVIHDLDDELSTPQDAQQVIDHAGAERTTTQGLGHTRILRDADVCARVADFLDAGRAPTDGWTRYLRELDTKF